MAWKFFNPHRQAGSWKSREFDFKMTRNANVILSIFVLVTVQLAVYMTMVMQLHGLIFLWKDF